MVFYTSAGNGDVNGGAVLVEPSRLVYRNARNHAGSAAAALGDREFVWSLTSWMSEADRRQSEQAATLQAQADLLAVQGAMIQKLAADNSAMAGLLRAYAAQKGVTV